MIKVDYNYSDDSFCRALSVLKRSIGQYARNKKWIYIGLTQRDPEERFREHQSKWKKGQKWTKMIVIYKSRNLTQLVNIESKLIEHVLKEYKNITLNGDAKKRKPRTKLDKDGYWIYLLVEE